MKQKHQQYSIVALSARKCYAEGWGRSFNQIYLLWTQYAQYWLARQDEPTGVTLAGLFQGMPICFPTGSDRGLLQRKSFTVGSKNWSNPVTNGEMIAKWTWQARQMAVSNHAHATEGCCCQLLFAKVSCDYRLSRDKESTTVACSAISGLSA